MTDSAIVGVTFAFIFFIGVSVVATRSLRTSGDHAQRYRLFELRDQVYRLVIEEKIERDSVVFTVVCTIVNGVVSNIRDFNLRSLARAYVRSDRKAFKSERAVERFFDEVKRADPEVQAVVLSMFNTLADILARNSRWTLAYISADRHMSRLLKAVTSFVADSVQIEAYQLVANHQARLASDRELLVS